MEANLGESESLQKNLLSFLDSMLSGRHRQYYETFDLLVKLRGKDLTRFFKEAQSFTDTPILFRLLGFKRCYLLMFMVQTSTASSSNVSLQVLLTSLQEILHYAHLLSPTYLKVI
jgi:hypothetical protein